MMTLRLSTRLAAATATLVIAGSLLTACGSSGSCDSMGTNAVPLAPAAAAFSLADKSRTKKKTKHKTVVHHHTVVHHYHNTHPNLHHTTHHYSSC